MRKFFICAAFALLSAALIFFGRAVFLSQLKPKTTPPRTRSRQTGAAVYGVERSDKAVALTIDAALGRGQDARDTRHP